MAKGFNLTATINLQGPTNIKQVVNNINKQLGSISANVNLNISAKTVQSITKVNKSLQTLNQTLGATTQSATTATQAFNNLAAAMASVGNVNLPTNITGPVNNITSSVTSASKALGQTRTEFEDFGRQAGLAVRRFAAFSTVTSVIYSFSNAMSKGIQQYIEFDKQVTRLSQVTNESKASLGSLVGEITRLSTGLGVASEDLATVSVTLAQAGFSAQDTRRALEALAKSALAPSFDNLNQTVEGSIALMRQFGISAVELEGALGSVNAVAAAFAVEASDIIAAIQRTGGVFASASKGVSEGTDALNEFIAVFTSIRATTRESAETIATGLRTIFTRIQRADTVEALKEYGVVLTDLEGKFVGPYEAVRRLSEGLSGLDPRNLKFSQIIEELGGFRQIGKVLPLIQQFATAQDALKVAQEGQGSLATDAAKGQLALAVQIQQVREEFSALVRSIGDGKGFQTLVRLGLDLAGALIKVADATKGVLPLIGIMAAFRGVTAITQFAGGFGGGLTGGNKKAQGGRIHRFASGGVVPGVGDADTVPAMLTPGEFVMNKSAVRSIGKNNLQRLNLGGLTNKVPVKTLASRSDNGPNIKSFKEQSENFIENDDTVEANIRKRSFEDYGFEYKDYDIITNRLKEQGVKFPIGSKKGSSRGKFDARSGPIMEDLLREKMGKGAKKYEGVAGYSDISNAPIDIIKGKNIYEVKFKSGLTSDNEILGKLLRYKLENAPYKSVGFKENIKNKKSLDDINLGSINLISGSDLDGMNGYKSDYIAYLKEQNKYKLAKGGKIQKFINGGVAQRKVGYIDYDVIANEANKDIVEKGMKETGSDGPRIYSDYLTKLAVNARKSSSIQKLRAIYGVAGSGKTTLARGQGTDSAKLRQTERFPILSPEDIQKATEILILTSSVSQAKMDDFFGDVDRAYTLSSTTDAERQGVRSRKESRDITGIGLENRKPGTTMGVSTDSAVGEALLSDKLGAKSTVLGRSDSGRLRRKRGNELVDIIKKKIGLTWGGFAPTTAGHESLLDAAAAMGIPPEDFIALVGANEAVDESSYRTAIFDQDSRVLLAKAGFGAKGATVLPKPRDFEVPQGFDLTQQGSDRRQVLIPGQGSTVFVADKTEKQIEKYKEAGYKVKTTERTGGISGTGVRDLMIAGDMTKLQSVLSPGVYDLISNNIGRIQNRASVLPSLIEQAQKEAQAEMSQVDQAIEALGIKRIDSKKIESDPEYAAKVEVLKELRTKKQKMKSAAGFTPYKLLDALAQKDPQNYALDFSTSSNLGNVPDMRVMGQNSQASIPAGRVAQLAQEKNKSIQDVILEQLGGLGGPAGVKKILGIGSGDRTLSSLLQAGNIKGGKGLDEAADYVNRALAARGIRDAAEAKRLEEYKAKALHFGIAGLLPMDYSKEFEWDIGGTDVYATARGFGSTYLEEARQMQKESSALAQKFAENVQNKSIFGGGEKLAFDFDKTLVEDADILDAKGSPDIAKYSNREAVQKALENARPTRLAAKLKSLIEEDPSFIKQTRILTARPQSTADLLAQSLQSFGLPYTIADITGVSNGLGSNIATLKAANLQEQEKLIDDNLDNIRAAQKAGKKGFQYVEPKSTTSELDEKMGQGNIEGAIVEKALAVLGAPVRPDAKQNRAIDYPDGLGSAAQFFPGIDPGIPTEVKRTIDGSSLEKVREEIGRYISGGAEAVKLAVGGVATKTRKTKEPFGTGETEFPIRISKKYAEEQYSASENLRAKLAWEKNPKDERIMVDDQKVQEAYQRPFDRDRFAASFKEKISRDSLFERMSDFAKFVGLPQEDLTTALPLQLDFGASKRGGGLGMFAAAQFEKGAIGIRPYEGYDLAQFGYGEKEKQESYGLEKLIEAKQKEIKKITNTPTRTFDDGSFSFDSEAYQKANIELDSLKNRSFKLKDLKREAEKEALTEQNNVSSATGRGTISFAPSMGYSSDTKNSTLYHEMTHQLFEGLRKKSADSFNKYRDRVSSLFSGDNDDLADAFDSLTAGGGYSSADVVYGRSYKSNNLSQILASYYRQNLDSSRGATPIPEDITKNLASLSTQSSTAKKAREYRPINPKVNEALLQGGDKFGMTQEKINRMEDNGKEEFLTSLIEKAPQLDQNLQTILDSTLTELLSGSGIQRQKYAAGRRVDYEAGVGASPFGDSLSKRLSQSVYDLQKGTGLSDSEFNEIKKTADTYGYNEEEFKEYLAKRVQEKKNKGGLKTNPSALAQQLMPQTKTLRPELRALADSLKDTSNDIGYRPSALENIAQARTDIKNARGFAVGGVAEPEQKKEKQYGKISITEDSGMISAGYLKSGTENSRQGHATASKLRDNLYYVGLSSATKGYGPRLYDVLMEAVTEKGAMLTSDRSSVSGDARKVWEYYFNNRGDVKKTPLEPKDWTQNEALLDPKLYGKKETWPPATDPAWILQSGYSKSPSLIKGPDVVRPSTKPDTRAMALSYFSSRAPKFADGGTVPALVSNGEAYVPPKVAKRIGYGNLKRMNQADRNGMNRFSDGGISVFKGPGTGTSDSIPANLPVGSFIIREKATKALGFNNGGLVGARVQQFAFGGSPRGPAPRPDTISLDTIGATDQATAALKNVAAALTALGVSSSKSAQLLNRGYQATAAEATRAYQADLLMAKAAGASADVLYDLETALEQTKKQAEAEVKIRTELGDIDGGELQDILSGVEDRIRSLTETARAGAQSRGLSDEEAEKEVREGSASRRAQAFEEAASNRGTDLGALGATGNDLERVINNLARDARTLEQMNRQYAATRRVTLEQEAAAARAAGKRALTEQEMEQTIKDEIQARRNAIQEVADSNQSRGPNDREKMDRQNSMLRSFAVMTVGNIIANNISTKSNSASAGVSGAVRGGTEAYSMTNQVINEMENLASTLTSAGGRAAQFGNLLSKGLKFAPYIQAVAVLGQAAIDAHNAMRQFTIDLEKSKIERALDGLGDKFEKLNKDLNQLNLLDEIKTNLIDASQSADRLRSATLDTATVGWINSLDVLVTSLTDAGDGALTRQSALRSQVLEKDGILEYFKINKGDSDAYNRAAGKFAGEQATESSASFKPIADGINQLIQARARAGETTESIISAPEFKDFAKSLVYADVALNKQIRQIELSTSYTEEAKKARIEEIISIEGANKARVQAAIGQREAEQKSLALLTSVYTRSLKRMFTNMEQAINATAFSLKKMSDSVDLATAAITGQAKVGNIDLETSNVIQNPRAYSGDQVASAQAAAGSLFGSRGPEMSKLMNLGETVESTVMSTINKTLENKGVDVSNESIASAVDQSVRVELKNLGLPPELADKLAKEVGSTLVDLRSSADNKIDFAKLSERLGTLNSVIDTAKDAQQAAIKALENYQNVLNQYANNINKIIDLETSARERSRKAIQINSDANSELAKSLGKTIKLSDAFAKRDASVARQTGGLTAPDDIFQKILKLNTDRQVQQSSAKQAAEKGPAGVQDFVKFNSELSQTNLALRENRAALEEMANNTDKASAAMSAIQEAQQKAAGRVGFLEKVVTSTPEELESLNQSLYRLQRNMNGQQNTIQNSIGAQKAYRTSLEQGASAAEAMRAAQAAFSNERKETLGTLQDILPFLGDSQQAGNIKANVLESMLQESGMGVSPLFQQVLNTLRNPEQDPATAAAMQYYQQAIGEQSRATKLLGDLDTHLAQDIARLNSKLIVEGLRQATLTFQNKELEDIANKVNTIIDIMNRPPAGGAPAGGAGAPPVVGIATGGLVYASAGQLINFQPQGTDTVPAMLTPGEFVVNRKSTQANLPLLQSINSNKYNSGGSVGYYAGGGLITNWGKPETIQNFDEVTKKEIINPSVPENISLLQEGRQKFRLVPPLYTLEFPNSSKVLPRGNSDPYSLANISLDDAIIVRGISPGLDLYDDKNYISNFDEGALREFVSPAMIKDDKQLYLGKKLLDTTKVSKLQEDEIKDKLDKINIKNTTFVNFDPDNFSDDQPKISDFPVPTKNRFSPNIRNPKSPGISTDGLRPALNAVQANTPIYKPWLYQRSLYNPAYGYRTMAASVNQPELVTGSPLGPDKYKKEDFQITQAGDFARYTKDIDSTMIPGKKIKEQAQTNKENLELYRDTLAFIAGGSVYEKNGKGTALQDRLRSLFDNQASFITLTKPDLLPFDELKDAETAIIGQQSLEQSFRTASEVNRGAGSKIKFGLTGPPPAAAPPESILSKPFTITDDAAPPASKSYPFMINGTIKTLGADFENKAREEAAKRTGKVSSKIITDNLKLTLPFDLNGSKPTIDVPISYEEYTGELYDVKASKFDGKQFNTLLPTKADSTLFQKLDTSSHRLFTPTKYTEMDILSRSSLKDPAMAAQLVNLMKLRVNNDPNVATETAKVSAGLELVFKDPQNSLIKYPNAAGDGSADVFSGMSDEPTKVNIGEFVLKKLEEFRGKVASGAAKVAEVPGLKKGATFSDADLPKATSALIRGSMGLFGNLRLPGFPSGWLVKSGAATALRAAASGNPVGAAGHMSGIFNQAGAFISQLQNKATTVPAYNALDNASTMISGAANAFASLAGGDTSLLKQFYEQKIQIADVFRSFGASARFGKVAGMKLSPDWQNILGSQLSGTKIKTVGRDGSLEEKELAGAIPENATVNDLIKVIFNPYNEFPNKSSRADLIQKFGNDLFNLRGPNRMPYFDRQTLNWIGDGLIRLKKWYGGEGNWLGQDYFFDTAAEPDNAARMSNFLSSLTADGKKYYKRAQEAQVLFGLANAFGPLPGEEWFTARGAVLPQNKATGGIIYAQNGGGPFVNFAPKGTDTVPAMLTPGEFVVNAKATAKNLPLLKSINSGGIKGLNKGGVIYASKGALVDHQPRGTGSGEFIVNRIGKVKNLALRSINNGSYSSDTNGSQSAIASRETQYAPIPGLQMKANSGVAYDGKATEIKSSGYGDEKINVNSKSEQLSVKNDLENKLLKFVSGEKGAQRLISITRGDKYRNASMQVDAGVGGTTGGQWGYTGNDGNIKFNKSLVDTELVRHELGHTIQVASGSYPKSIKDVPRSVKSFIEQLTETGTYKQYSSYHSSDLLGKKTPEIFPVLLQFMSTPAFSKLGGNNALKDMMKALGYNKGGMVKAISSNNYSSGGVVNYLEDGGKPKDNTWIGSDNLAISALGWLGGMGEATGRAAYGAANVVSGALVSGSGRLYQGGAYLAGSESQQAAGAAFAQVGEQAVIQGAYSAVELGQAAIGRGPIQTGEKTALQIGDAARVESVRQGQKVGSVLDVLVGDDAASFTEGAQTVGFVTSQLAQMGASLGMGTGNSVAGAFARATSVVDRLSDLGTLAPVLSKIPGMKALGGGAQAATAGVAKILHSAGEAMPTFKRFLVDPTAKFLTEAGSVADNLDVVWGAVTSPKKAKALEKALEDSGGSWAKAMETIKPPTPSATAASKAATSSTPTPTTKAADDVTDAIKLPKAQRLLVEDQVNKFRQLAQEARAQEITQHIKWAEGEANSIVSKMPTTASDDLRKIGFDLDMGPPPAAIRNDDLIGDIISKQMDNDNVWKASRAQALQDAEKALKNKEAIDAFRKGVDDPNIKFENRTWRDWSSNKVNGILEKLPKSKTGRLLLGGLLGAGAAGLVWLMSPKNQPGGIKEEQRTDLAPTLDPDSEAQPAVAGAPGVAPQVPSSPIVNAAANAAATTKPQTVPDYYDELTYKEYVSRELAAGNPPPAPDKKLFTTAAFYAKDKDGSFRQTAYDRRASNIPQQVSDGKDPKKKSPIGRRNQESQMHTRTAAFAGAPMDIRDVTEDSKQAAMSSGGFASTGQFGTNQNTKEGNARIKDAIIPTQLQEAYGAEPMAGEDPATAENRAQTQSSRKITGRKGIESQYKSAYSFYRRKLGEYTYYNSVNYQNKDKFAQGQMKNRTETVARTLSSGGVVYASNGTLIPYAPKGTDTVPAMLTPGEFVINRQATQRHLPLLQAINNGGDIKGLNKGGVVYLAGGSPKPIDVFKSGNKAIKSSIGASEVGSEITSEEMSSHTVNKARDFVASGLDTVDYTMNTFGKEIPGWSPISYAMDATTKTYEALTDSEATASERGLKLGGAFHSGLNATKDLAVARAAAIPAATPAAAGALAPRIASTASKYAGPLGAALTVGMGVNDALNDKRENAQDLTTAEKILYGITTGSAGTGGDGLTKDTAKYLTSNSGKTVSMSLASSPIGATGGLLGYGGTNTENVQEQLEQGVAAARAASSVAYLGPLAATAAGAVGAAGVTAKVGGQTLRLMEKNREKSAEIHSQWKALETKRFNDQIAEIAGPNAKSNPMLFGTKSRTYSSGGLVYLADGSDDPIQTTTSPATPQTTSTPKPAWSIGGIVSGAPLSPYQSTTSITDEEFDRNTALARAKTEERKQKQAKELADAGIDANDPGVSKSLRSGVSIKDIVAMNVSQKVRGQADVVGGLENQVAGLKSRETSGFFGIGGTNNSAKIQELEAKIAAENNNLAAIKEGPRKMTAEEEAVATKNRAEIDKVRANSKDTRTFSEKYLGLNFGAGVKTAGEQVAALGSVGSVVNQSIEQNLGIKPTDRLGRPLSEKALAARKKDTQTFNKGMENAPGLKTMAKVGVGGLEVLGAAGESTVGVIRAGAGATVAVGAGLTSGVAESLGANNVARYADAFSEQGAIEAERGVRNIQNASATIGQNVIDSSLGTNIYGGAKERAAGRIAEITQKRSDAAADVAGNAGRYLQTGADSVTQAAGSSAGDIGMGKLAAAAQSRAAATALKVTKPVTQLAGKGIEKVKSVGKGIINDFKTEADFSLFTSKGLKQAGSEISSGVGQFWNDIAHVNLSKAARTGNVSRTSSVFPQTKARLRVLGDATGKGTRQGLSKPKAITNLQAPQPSALEQASDAAAARRAQLAQTTQARVTATATKALETGTKAATQGARKVRKYVGDIATAQGERTAAKVRKISGPAQRRVDALIAKGYSPGDAAELVMDRRHNSLSNVQDRHLERKASRITGGKAFGRETATPERAASIARDRAEKAAAARKTDGLNRQAVLDIVESGDPGSKALARAQRRAAERGVGQKPFDDLAGRTRQPNPQDIKLQQASDATAARRAKLAQAGSKPDMEAEALARRAAKLRISAEEVMDRQAQTAAARRAAKPRVTAQEFMDRQAQASTPTSKVMDNNPTIKKAKHLTSTQVKEATSEWELDLTGPEFDNIPGLYRGRAAAAPIKAGAGASADVIERVTARKQALAENLGSYASSPEAAEALKKSGVFDIGSVEVRDSLKARNVGGDSNLRAAGASYSPSTDTMRLTKSRVNSKAFDASIDHELTHRMQKKTIGGLSPADGKAGPLVYEEKLRASLGSDFDEFLSSPDGYKALREAASKEANVGSLYAADRIQAEPVELFTSLVQASHSSGFAQNTKAVEMLKKLMKFHGYAKGGIVYASNGASIGAKQGTDSVPAMLTPGEFVVNARSAQKNLPLLHSINANKYAAGGRVAYLADGTQETPEEKAARLQQIREEKLAQKKEALEKKRAIETERKKALQKQLDDKRTAIDAARTSAIAQRAAPAQQRKQAMEMSRKEGISPQQAMTSMNRRTVPGSDGRDFITGDARVSSETAVRTASPQQQGIPQISPQTQQRVGMAAQAAFDPRNAGDMNKQLVIFGTLLTGVNQVITQFGAVMQQLVAGAGQAGGGVNNNGQGTPSTDGISQFTTSLNNFVNQLQKLNIPEQINISLTQTKPIDVNINGADALQQLLGGPLGEMIRTQVTAALNQRDVNDEKPAS